MSPVAGSGPSGPAKPKKKKRVTKPTVVSTPTPSYDATPSRSTYGPSYAPKPAVSPSPSYTRPPKVKPQQIANTNVFDFLQKAKDKVETPKDTPATKSSGNVSDFLRGIRSAGRTDESPILEGSDALSSLLNAPMDEDTSFEKEDRHSDIKNFVQNLRPSNFDPEYGGIALPEKFKHFRNNRNAPLQPFWDADYIKSNLSDHEPGSSFAKNALNGIIKQQLQDRNRFMFRNLDNKAKRVTEFLETAQQDAYEGDFDTLGNKLEKNPNFLDLPSYKQDYSVTPEKIWKDWEQRRGGIKDEWMKVFSRAEVDMQMKHYTAVRDFYRTARSRINNAVDKYEKKFNKSVEYNDLDPKKYKAIPEVPEKDMSLVDKVGQQEGRGTKLAEYFGGEEGAAQAIRQTRRAVKRELGIKDLPTVKEMLAVKVAQGEVDPDNEEQLDAWIARFQNPNHPETRAMYVGFAKQINKKIKDEDALEFVNGPIKKYAEDEQKRLTDNAKDRAKADKVKSDVKTQSFLQGLYSGLPGFSGDEGSADVANTGIGWTIDKLARANYAVAGAAQSWYSLDKDPTIATPWTYGGVASVLADPLKMITGKSIFDSVDEVIDNPSAVGEPVNETYQQFFRGSNLPGIKKDIVPTTFSQVIATQAAKDSEDNVYDKEWYQHTAGFVADVAFDPLNLIGVGIVDDTLKIPTRIVKEARLNAGRPETDVDKFLDAITAPDKGAAAERAFRGNQALARMGDEITGDGPALITDAETFKYVVEYSNEASFVERATDLPVYTQPRFTNEFAEQQKQIKAQIKVLKNLEEQVPSAIAAKHLTDELSSLAKEMGGNIRVPELRVHKLMERTAIPVKVDDLTLSNPGGKFWRYILKPLADEDVIRAWPGHTTSTKFDTIVEDGSQRLTVKAADAKRAIDEEEAAYRNAEKLGVPIERVANEATRTRWAEAIDRGYDTDPVTGKPGLWEEADVDSYLDEGAPGLLDTNGFDPVGEFASAAGIPKEEFEAIWSKADVLHALHNGPRMLAKQDPEVAEGMRIAQSRIRDSKAKLKIEKDPKVRQATAKALAMGYEQMSQHTLAGAFRYLDTLRANKTQGLTSNAVEDIDNLDKVIAKAEDELLNSRTDAEDLAGYVGAFGKNAKGDVDFAVPDAWGNKPQAFRGTYEGFDFRGKSLNAILEEVGPENFASRSAQLDDALTHLKRQRAELNRAVKTGRPTELTPAEAYKIDRILPLDSSFRKADGSVNFDKVGQHLKPKTVFDDDAGKNVTFKVNYTLAKPKAAQDSPEMIRYSREIDFLDTVAKYVEDAARNIYRTKKTEAWEKAVEKAPGGVSEDIARFWTRDGSQRVGPAERKLGPKPTAESIHKKYPNYTTRQVKDRAGEVKTTEMLSIDKETGTRSISDFTSPGPKTAKQRKLEALIKGERRRWDKARLRAREIDQAEFKRLKAEQRELKSGFSLTANQTKAVYQESYHAAVQQVKADISQGIIKQTTGNAKLPVGDVAKALEKQINDEFKYQALQLRIRELKAAEPEELAQIRSLKSQLNTQRRKMYGEIKKVKAETNLTRLTMKRKIAEEHVLQALMMPARVDGKVIQIRLAGMTKNLQFTGNMFRAVEKAADIVPDVISRNFANAFVRPSKLVNEAESFAIRAKWESKTPVIIHANLRKLSEVMGKLPADERMAMMGVIRKGLPYAGRYKAEFDAIKTQMDDFLKIINGSNENYMFSRRGKFEADPLHIHEILRFLPAQYSFDTQYLYRLSGRKGEFNPVSNVSEGGVPFSPIPAPRSDISWDDLLTAIENNGHATPKDLEDPFRLGWVLGLAADQASSLRGVNRALEETFGVIKPDSIEKARVWSKLRTLHGWENVKGLDNDVLFPPEIVKEIKQVLEFTQPGKAQNDMVKMFDQAIGYWKQGMTIYNPAYYTRNGIGEMMTSWLDGVNSPKWYARAHRVHKYANNEGHDIAELVKKFDVLEGTVPVDIAKGNEVLFSLKGGQKVRIEDALKWYIDTGMKSTFANTDLAQGVRGLASEGLNKGPVRKSLSHMNNKVHDTGEGFEDWLRMAHFLHAMENSGKGTLEAAAMYAAQRVRRSHFDYTDFSNFEKSVMLRAFPFYKWIRRGAPLMVAHLFMTPGKMAALPKALDTMSGLGLDPINAFNEDPVMSTSDVFEDKNGHLPDYQGIAPGWVRDLFAYQMGPAEDDEYVNYFRVTTPQIDGLTGITSFAQNYQEKGLVGGLADSTAYPLLNPAIKMGTELAQNKGMDPDFPHEIYGGEYNENIGLNNAEAIGTYAARNLNPWTNFLQKLSKRGELPFGNVANEGKEHPTDATRDVSSFFTGLGFYQAKPGDAVDPNGNTIDKPPAVGSIELPYLTDFPGRAGVDSTNGKAKLDVLMSKLANAAPAAEDATAEKKKSSWVDYPKRKKGKWVNYPDGSRKWVEYGRGSGGSYSSSSSSNWDLMDLLKRLRDMVDQGRIADTNKFEVEE